MGATSVTGVSGPGDSNGKYKPELHCGGCACGCQGDECNPPAESEKVGCYISYRSGGNAILRNGNSIVNVKGC